MIRSTTIYPIVVIVILASLILAACDSQAEATQEAVTEEGAAITTEASEPDPAEGEPEVAETEEAAQPTEEEEIVHEVMPETPLGSGSILTDRSTAVLASEGRALADNYQINILERPFAPDGMQYQANLDIVRAEISLNGDFLYISIFLEGEPTAGSETSYGVEFDLDVDGRGDWLIFGPAPTGDDWTTDGVRACTDQDEDVGGATPMRSDTPVESLTGYEDCVFDSGRGIGPDEAWIRIDPDNPKRVQIAVLHSLLGFDERFVWSVWADANGTDPGYFDYHDQITPEEAGSADITSENYPLKELGLFDNTCRWSYGFTPTGTEIGICTVPATPIPEGPTGCIKPAQPSADPCWFWDQDNCVWVCFN
jgi:hypothetical protein